MVLTPLEKSLQNLETCSIIINGKNTHSNRKLIIHLMKQKENKYFLRKFSMTNRKITIQRKND